MIYSYPQKTSNTGITIIRTHMQHNIFAGNGIKSQFVNLIYQELMKRKYVSLTDILVLHYNRSNDYYNKYSCSKETGYGELKKAFPEVVRAIEAVCPGSISDNGKKGKRSAKIYTGNMDDPLAEERTHVVKKSLEDYVTFCKSSVGLLPASWFSSFFENTQLMLDSSKDEKEGNGTICSSLEQNLTNLELLPLLYNAITNKHALSFSYHSFGHPSYELVFHPQFLKEYNGRWFLFGKAEGQDYYPYVVPIDRICSSLENLENIDYIPAEKGFYKSYFKNIIGVTHERNASIERVVIRTKTEYQHGLILTKPLHHSQVELKPYGEHNGELYGEIQLTVEPNRELRGKILTYGRYLEVIAPESLKRELQDEITVLYRQYS